MPAERYLARAPLNEHYSLFGQIAEEDLFRIVPRGVVYESWILARSTHAQLTTADNRAG
jgi:hypothetical protein